MDFKMISKNAQYAAEDVLKSHIETAYRAAVGDDACEVSIASAIFDKDGVSFKAIALIFDQGGTIDFTGLIDFDLNVMLLLPEG
ncbi:hypothetical protein [Paenibacillus oceani]|uniref:Uncharacterized protein n=1 Tax=Paenibacillus oceani TaxID=2772510 RepID=A0A927GZ10_9BACL|nr:hypothetical protein [Paenibacillus oceani]MBD2862486.1 hypothetical protein [Paenibacillus oceani]